MTADDFVRMWKLYDMAAASRTGEAHVSLRDAALDGIVSEIIKQGCAMAWLRDVLHPSDILSTCAAGMVIVVVRDRHSGGFRGASGADENEAAANTIGRHLPYCGLLP